VVLSPFLSSLVRYLSIYLSILYVSSYFTTESSSVLSERRMTRVLLFFIFVWAILHEIFTSYTWSFTLKRTLGFLFSLNEIEFCCIIWFCYCSKWGTC
jgi:hypothetical protein